MGMKDQLTSLIRNISQRYKLNREREETQNMLKASIGGDASRIFNPVTLSWIFVAITFFLQLISLATTYSGSKVYFGGIKLPFALSAPLLFALSVQLTVFALSNSLKKNFKTIILVILFTATLCSIYFSYIGIYNYINSPIVYLEEKYNQIYRNMTNRYKVSVDNSRTLMKEYVYDITGRIQKEYIRLSKENDNYNRLSEQIARVEMDSKVITPNTGTVIKPNINNYGSNLDKYYEDMAKYNAATTSIVRQAAEQNSSLQSTLYDNKIKTILQGKSLEQFAKEQAETQTGKELLYNRIISIHSQIANDNIDFDKRISAIQQYCVNYIDSQDSDKEKFNSILVNMYTVLSDVTGTKVPEEFYRTLNSFFTISDNKNYFMKSLDSVKGSVYKENYGQQPSGEVELRLDDTLLLFSKLQSEIKNGAYILNTLPDKDTAIDLSNEEFLLENMYILPMKNLFTRNTSLHIAWFCFMFAALIDGLTLLFALSHRGNPKTLLAKRNSELMKNNEDLMEELLISSLILHHSRDENSSSMEQCLESLAGFITLFKIGSAGMEKGYSLYCPLSKLKDYHIFLSVLCQFNLAKIISREDFAILENIPSMEELKRTIREENSYQVLEETAASSDENEEDSYIILKTKFAIWVNQKLAIASSNERLSGTVRNILKAMEQKS